MTELQHAAFDPEIVRIAGDVKRPRAPVPYSDELDHLPGESGLWAGAQTLFGSLYEGEAYFQRLVRRHGGLFRTRLGLTPVVCVADPDLIWTVLRNEEGVFSSALPWTDFFLGLTPGGTVDGPLALDFERHRDARKLLQPAFGAPAIAGYLEGAQAIYARTIDDWLRRGRIPFKSEVRRMFAAVSARIFMGVEDPAEVALLDRAMIDGWQSVLALRKRSRLSPGWRRARRGVGTLWRTLRPRMGPGREGKDLFSRLCRVEDEAGWLDDDTRMRLFITVMFAAFDTTASGAASMGYLLARHPDWQERLREEGRSIGARPGIDELKALEQQEWVWRETLRSFPVAGQLARQTLREVTLGRWRIPSAAFVQALVGSAANDPNWWTAPERFDPERFSPARAEDKRHKAIFLPFGAGAHTCIGAQLAGIEIKAFWHALLRRCRIELVHNRPEHHSYTPVGVIRGDLAMRLSPIPIRR